MKQTKTVTSLVQEINSHGQHRIVVIKNGIPTTSPWFEHHTIAVFGQYRGSLMGTAALPQGIFTVKQVPHEVLA